MGRLASSWVVLVVGCGTPAPDATPATDPCATSPANEGPDEPCVEGVSGTVVDAETGAPLPGILVTVCAGNCFSPEGDSGSAATGRFTVAVESRIRVAEYVVSVHGRPDFAPWYFPLPTEQGGDIELGEVPLLRLPASGPALAVRGEGAPAQAVTSGELTLEVEAGTEVRLDVEDVALGEAARQLRVRSVPPALHARFAPGLGPLLALHAPAPFEARFRVLETGEPGVARVAFAVPAGLAPGAAVEVLTLGSSLYPELGAPGRFGAALPARVSADGARVELDPGVGIPLLTWMALRAPEVSP